MNPDEFAARKAQLEKDLTRKDIWQRCKASPIYFVFWFVEILSSEEETWIPFRLWPSQADLLKNLEFERRIILLKARQLGFTTFKMIDDLDNCLRFLDVYDDIKNQSKIIIKPNFTH